MINPYADKLIELALAEDIGDGDLSANALATAMRPAVFTFLAKDDFILAGTEIARRVFAKLDPAVEVEFFAADGDRLRKGDKFGEVRGRTSVLLTGERTALNFLQRMSGIATNTRAYLDALGDTNITIIDTRKTLPGWRSLEKYAVRMGGGTNHRHGLYDGVMLKDNHIDAAGGITGAVKLARKVAPITVRIEVEVRTLDEVTEAVSAGADIIMLDNFPVENIAKACEIIGGRAKVEVSGGITQEKLANLRGLPIDYVSIGALTHQAKNVDISLKYTREL